MCVFNLISQQFVVVVLVSTKTFILNQKEADTHIKNKSFNGKSATVGHNIFFTNARTKRSSSCLQHRLFVYKLLMFSVLILTSFLMPPYCLTALLALRNLATLAMVSAAKAFRSLTVESKILTMLCRPPMSTMARRICKL